MKKHTDKVILSRLSFERKILAFFIMILVIIIAVACIYILIGRETYRTRQEIAETEKLLKLTDSLVRVEHEMVIGTRSYLITGKSAYQAVAKQKNDSFRYYMQQLGRLGKEPGQQKKMDSLERFYRQYTTIQQATILRRQQNTLPPQQAETFILEIDKLLASLNDLIDRWEKETHQLLADRRGQYRADVQQAAVFLRILLLVFILSLLSAFVVVFRNSRKRTSAEAALRRNKELIRSLIEHAPLQVNVKDRNGTYLLVNQQFAYTLQASPEEVIGKTLDDFRTREQTAVIYEGDNEVIQTLEPTEFEVKLPGPDGQHTYIATKFPLFDEKGSLYAIGSTYVDITPVKAAHEALQKSYQKQQQILNGFQQALSASSDLLCMINDQGTLVMVSDTVELLLGYTPKQMMNKRYADFIAGSDREVTRQFVEGVQQGTSHTSVTNHCLHRDGRLIPMTWSAHWVAEERMLYCIGRDATESQQAARQLAQSQERLVYAQKIARLGNWEWDIKNNIWSCSEELYTIFGTAPSETGAVQELMLQAIHPDDRERVYHAREEVLKEEQKLDIEFRILRVDGQERHVQVKGEALYNANKQAVWFSGTIQDITERKTTELLLQQANEALQQQATELKASNEELERFAYVASHDLQEPLRMVSSFLSLLKKRLAGQLDDPSNTYIHYATDGAERMKQLIQDLLHYSRIGSTNEPMGPVDMKEVVTNACHLLSQPIAESGAEIRTGDLPHVWGHKTQLNQLVLNLLSNALKYRGTAPPVIGVGCTEQKDRWEFFIRDNGIGIDPKFFDKIFIIFQRLHTKNDYSGTGIGLALCKKIAERHGGHIRVESAPGKGSTFFFTLKKLHHD